MTGWPLFPMPVTSFRLPSCSTQSGFSLSYRDVEDLLAERGVDASYETIRRWVLKFGVLFARELRKRRPRTSAQWHLDELLMVIGGQRFFLWRAVDSEAEVLDLLLQRRGLRARRDRDGQAALLWRRQGAGRSFSPPRAVLAQEQPGQKLASAHPAVGA
jgi:hypothetical protein